MRDFDINKIGKKMPYEAPNEEFFENFTNELLAKVEEKPKRRFSLLLSLAPIVSIAAVIAVVITVALRPSGGDILQDQFLIGEYTISESVDESIDSFLNSLSDDEIAYLAMESSYHDDFFSNLPDNN